MSISSRHHYIPIFFLKGFTNDKGEFFVFDKQKNMLLNKPFRPKSYFYEPNRNTVNIEGEETDFIEKVYSKIDTLCASTFNKLQNPIREKLNHSDLWKIITFINVLNWRTPHIDQHFNTYLETLSSNERKFKIFDKATGEDVTQEVYDVISKDENFIKAYRSSIGLVNFTHIKDQFIDDLKFYYSSENTFHVCGDNPLICISPMNIDQINTVFLIPLTKNIVLVHKNDTRLETISSELRIKIDILIFMQSEKYICSANKDYLNTLAFIARTYDNNGLENLKLEILSCF